MDTMYPPPGDGDPQDSGRTEQFWTSQPGPAGGDPQHPAGPAPQPGQLEQHYTKDRRHALRWTVGLSLALVLAAAGVIGGVTLASHPSSSLSQASDSTAAHTGTAAAGQPQTQAASLNSVLNAADTTGTMAISSAPAASSTAKAPAKPAAQAAAKPAVKAAIAAKIRACRRALAALRAARRTHRPALIKAARKAVAVRCHGLLRHHRLFRFVLLRGVVGQFTFHTKQGKLVTLAFERGVIKSVSGSTIVVRTVTGITEIWHLVGNTVVREHGMKAARSALTSGEPVWVGGPVIHGARDARLIVIRPPSAPKAATPAPSASGS
jgi:hypothetical protein